jgi:hypothetical protein
MNDEATVSHPAPEEKTTDPQGSSTLNLSGRSSSLDVGYMEDYRRHMQSGARWFYWIAGLSMVNSIAASLNSQWSFLAGLGVTQFISGLGLGLSEDLGGAANVIALILNALVAAFFVFLGVFAGKGHMWAFIIGLVVYVLDGLVFLALQLWLPLAFHVFVFYCLYKGLSANRKLRQLEAENIAT